MKAVSLGPRRAVWGAALLIVGACLGTYAGSLRAPFVHLDLPAIVDNASIRDLRSLGRVLRPPSDGGLTVGGRPLVNLTLALNYAWSGTDPWSYHAVNVAVHTLAALLLFGLVRRTCLRLSPGGSSVQSRALLTALAVALPWALHPLQTEAVTYVIQRAESLMGMLYLLTLYAFVRSVEAGGGPDPGRQGADPSVRTGPGRSLAWAVVCAGACLAGMATKEVMVSAPLAVLFYDRVFVSGSLRRAWGRHRALLAGLGSTWLLLAALVAGTGGNRGGTAGFGLGVPWGAYLLSQGPAVLRYLRLAAWPQGLVFSYPAHLGALAGAGAAPAGLCAAAVVLAGLACAAALARGRPWGFLGALFFAILAPTSLVPGATQTVAEHRMYLALAPVLAATLGAAAWAWLGRAGPGDGVRAGNGPSAGPARPTARGRTLAVLGATLLLGALWARATVARNRVYLSALSLWTDTVAKAPDNPYARNNLGVLLASAGRGEQARLQFEEALRIEPGYAEAHDNLGLSLAESGRRREAIAQFETAVRLKPDFATACVNLGVSWAALGRPDRAAEWFGRALGIDPRSSAARSNLAAALASLGRFDEAIGRYREVLAAEPDAGEVHYNLAGALARSGRWPEAARQYAEAVRLMPGSPEARADLGAALAQSGRLEEAVQAYRAALALTPADPDIHGNLSLAYRALGQVRQADAEAAEAARLAAAQTR